MGETIKPYWDELVELSQEKGVDLLTAYRHAGISERSYYRTKANGKCRHETAERVAAAIEQLAGSSGSPPAGP